MKSLILYPMAFYVFYIFLLLAKMFLLRMKYMKDRTISYKYFKAYQGCEIPEECVVHARHFDNQFQVPVLFFITCLVSLIVAPNSALLIYLAWGFVVSRIFHSIIHLGYNHPLHRAATYGLGWILVIAMWILLVL